MYVKSLKDLFKNPVLFLPDILNYAYTLLAILLIILFLDIKPLLLQIQGQTPAIISQSVISFLSVNLVKIIISFVFFMITTFFISSGLLSAKYNYILDLMKNKQLISANLRNYFKKTYWKIVKLRIYTALAVLIVGIFVSILSSLIYMILPNYQVILIIALALVSALFASLILFFRYPVMFLKNESPYNSLKQSYKYFMKNRIYVFKIWLIITLTTAFLSMISKSILQFTIIFPYVVTLIVSIWLDIYLFRAFKLFTAPKP